MLQVVANRRRHWFMRHLLCFRWWLLDVATVWVHASSLVLQVVATRRRHWFMRRLLCFRWWLLDVATVWVHASSLPTSLTSGRESSREFPIDVRALQGSVERHVRRHPPPLPRHGTQASGGARQSPEHLHRDTRQGHW